MKFNKLILAGSILTILATVIVYFYLPNTIPIHWNYKGEVDNYANRVFIFVSAVLPLAIFLIYFVLPKIDPKKESYLKHTKAYDILKHMTVIIMLLIHWVIVLVSLGVKLDVAHIIAVSVGVLFIVIGNFLPQLKQNYLVGIKTPWTLADEEVWKRTHRFGGYIFVIMGIVIILIGFINNILSGILLLGILIGGVLLMVIYSYVIYKTLRKKEVGGK